MARRPRKRRNVDIVTANLRYLDESNNLPDFSQILTYLNKKKYSTSGKKFEFRLMNSNFPDCIVGIVETILDQDVPPKKNKTSGVYSRLNVNPNIEGLAYGNILLYDKIHKILIYEVNRNGCYLDKFRDFIYNEWNKDERNPPFDLAFPTLIRKNEYDRMLNMNYLKEFIFQVSNPSELIQVFQETNDSIEKSIKKELESAKRKNSDILEIKFATRSKKSNPLGLSKSEVKGFVDIIRDKVLKSDKSNNVESLIVKGYSLDAESPRRILPIDLVADTFNSYFYIDDIQVQENIQEFERKIGVEDLFMRLLPEFKSILGD